MVLLRRIIGETLRSRRRAQQRTLRDVSASANVSLGYLSEIERGHKEASSELLSSICDALDVRLSEFLDDVTTTVAREEQAVHTPETVATLTAVSVPVIDHAQSLDGEWTPATSRAPRQKARKVAPPSSLAAARARRDRARSAPKASVAA